MTVRTWNQLVMLFLVLQVITCVAVLVATTNPSYGAAAFTWLVIGCPCMFGFTIPEKE